VPGRMAAAVLAAAAGAPVDVERDLATIRAADPQEILYRLLNWAHRRGVTLEGLEVSRPTLEDMFLQLTAGGAPG
jgi:hypothetical protein